VKPGREFQAFAVDVAEFLVDVARAELEFLERRVADGDDVARDCLLQHGRTGQLDPRMVAAIVDAAVVPREIAAHLGIGAIARADRVAVALDALGLDGHGHAERRRLAFARQDRDAREIVAVLEGVLRVADPLVGEDVPGLEAHVALQHLGIQRVLRDLDLTKAVQAAGVQRKVRGGRTVRGIHQQLAARQSCVQEPELQGSAHQVGLELLVGGRGRGARLAAACWPGQWR